VVSNCGGKLFRNGNGWQQMPPAVPLLYWMNGDDLLPMSVAAGSAASIAVGAIVLMTTMVSTAA
jgi:hypothetical protein